MLCSSIKLTDRREYKQDKTPKRNRSTMLEEKLFMKSDYYHSYTFRWDKPKKRHYSCNNSQFLAVHDITFPEHLSKLNESSPKDWLKRKPRPNTSDALPNFDMILNNEDDLSILALTDQFSRDTQEYMEEIKSTAALEEEEEQEIDLDIQQLILCTRESEKEKEVENKDYKEDLITEDVKSDRKRRRHKKKGKTEHYAEEKEKPKTKTKTIKFYLSKPPSPQTLEVIRVDVTSNFSMEEELPDTDRTASSILDCSRGCGLKILKNKEIKEKLRRKMAETLELSDNEVNVMCRRLILQDRKDEN